MDAQQMDEDWTAAQLEAFAAARLTDSSGMRIVDMAQRSVDDEAPVDVPD